MGGIESDIYVSKRQSAGSVAAGALSRHGFFRAHPQRVCLDTAALLKRGYFDSVVGKIVEKNFLRLVRAVASP